MRSHLLDTLPAEERQIISHALISLGITPQSRESLDEWARGSLSPRSRFTDWLAEAIKSAAVTEVDEPSGVRALLKSYYDVLRAGEMSDAGGVRAADVVADIPLTTSPPVTPIPPGSDALLVLLPLLIVLSTLLFLLLIFLIFVILLRKRRGIILRDHDGPLDLSREDIIEGEGGLEGVEQRWLDTVSEEVRRDYRRAKEWQQYNPPNSLPTDITLSQFLSIQEKGVSAWSFEPDYLSASVLIQSRTELTFLSSTDAATSVQSNLPLPKLNEVYYWEVKMFDKPETTSVSVGLATKPYPSFRMPGWAKHSIAYHSDGSKSYNYPFLTSSYGPHLLEGDTLGVGFRPRTGTVFFTRNGKKLEDAFIGLTRHNLFPTIGADGPCTVHVNLGQAGFVYIEANVKKWGLAPGVGTLAPPPAYGSERGSILLESGGATPSSPPALISAHIELPRPRRTHRTRRTAKPHSISSLPVAPSPLRTSISSSAPAQGISPLRRPPPPVRDDSDHEREDRDAYLSPTDVPSTSDVGGWRTHTADAMPPADVDVDAESSGPGSHSDAESNESALSHEGSPQSPNPPTPHVSDISMQSFSRSNSGRRRSRGEGHSRTSSTASANSLGSVATLTPGSPTIQTTGLAQHPTIGVEPPTPGPPPYEHLENGYIRPPPAHQDSP
ncbi:SPRY-domain-containing protein [Dacryopinax primogenitus]|uniref:SPRY-domain-containing protein n=1 Tax=Dacryopinax primogenitus (strain DJM 731) TaxID=1858805 RepID=M5FSI9_DACPD|nr:SPRY-domain-containing protein [Dacryopinax primogenitus]EJT98858.1 SPRY-domain-containing protein [Dacryopinax primogenitus]